MITLHPLTMGDYDKVAHIAVHPDQEKFSGTIHEAFHTPKDDGLDFHVICDEAHSVGFFKIDRLYPTRYDFAPTGDLGLRAFIIDLSLQGRGIATRAIRALPDYLQTNYPDAKGVTLTVNMSNPAAYAAYVKGGFTDTGQAYPHGDAGPQYVLRMAF